jgi:hypothetical protein
MVTKNLSIASKYAFTKKAKVKSIKNKDAEMAANAIYRERSCKFGILAQIHTDSVKKFKKKLSPEFFNF